MQGYRTYIVATLIAVSGALATTDWVKFMDDPKAGVVAIGAAAIMALMRSITNTPPGKQS